MNEINRNIWSVWDRFQDITNEIDRAPLIYPELERGGFLYVGMNPSLTDLDKPIDKGGENNRFSNMSRKEFYSIDVAKEGGNEWMNKEFSIQNACYENIGYFRPYNEIKSKLKDTFNMAIQHFDLFQMRETSQKEMLKVLQKPRTNKDNYPNLNGFGEAQYEIFKQVLKFIQPEFILIANAAAAHIVFSKEGIDINDNFNEDYGCHFLNVGDKKIPTLASGMLSGQRALDIYSRQRLFGSIMSLIKSNSK